MKMKYLARYGTALALMVLAACVDRPSTPAPQAEAMAAAQSAKPAGKPAADTATEASPKPAAAVKHGRITGVEMGQLFTLSQTGRVFLIDTRPPLFYRLGHIDGAVNFPLIKYDKVLPEMKPRIRASVEEGKLIVVYCQNSNCPDAHKLAKRLSWLGYDVTVYSGGWEEWKRSGLQ